jgi:hypothetical protein
VSCFIFISFIFGHPVFGFKWTCFSVAFKVRFR